MTLQRIKRLEGRAKPTHEVVVALPASPARPSSMGKKRKLEQSTDIFEIFPLERSLLSDEEWALLRYLFNPFSDEGEVIVETSRNWLSRKALCTLAPNSWLEDNVINVFGDILEFRDLKDWYITTWDTLAATTNPKGFVDRVKNIRSRNSTFLAGIEFVNKIYFPHHNQKHFNLFVVDVRNDRIQVWDSLQGHRYREFFKKTVENLMRSLSELYAAEIEAGKCNSFTDFRWDTVNDAAAQQNGHDCGVFTIRFMEKGDRMRKMKKKSWNSAYERAKIALQIVNNEWNIRWKEIQKKLSGTLQSPD